MTRGRLTIKQDEKALKDAVDRAVALLFPILRDRIRVALEQEKITRLSQLQALSKRKIKKIGSRIMVRGGDRYIRQILEEAEKAPS